MCVCFVFHSYNFIIVSTESEVSHYGLWGECRVTPQAARWEVIWGRGRVTPGSGYSGVSREWSRVVGKAGSMFVMEFSTSSIVRSLLQSVCV